MYQGEIRMTGSGPAIMPQSLPESLAAVEEMETRFGRVTISRSQSIIFSNGLLGIPDKMHYVLTRFPSEKMARFKLLQSLDDSQLSFITLPIDVVNPLIELDDLAQAARDLDIPMAGLGVLLVVTVHRESGVAKLSVNARAPILIHVNRRVAAQYVFPHTKYLIRQPLAI
jgi:flagellar assembly factor FliW